MGQAGGPGVEVVTVADDAVERSVRDGDVDAGIWTVGTAMGLINDIPTVGDLVARIVGEAEDLISNRLAEMVMPAAQRV